MLAKTTIATFVVIVMSETLALSATVPFVEDFGTGASNWFNAAGGAMLDWSATGGPDGSGHVFTSLSLAVLADGDSPVVFRAQDKFGSSGGAFEGNWVSDGVVQFRAFVRHDAPFPLTYFVRFSGPANFPGAIAVNFVPVFPNTWTEIVIAIDPSNPQFVTFEGSDFNTVFGNVGHVQVGVSVGDGQGGFPFELNFDLDKVAITNCVADCAGRECGTDSCGGSCGSCASGQQCGTGGACEASVVPEIPQAPTMSEWGLAVLSVLLLTGLTLKFCRATRLAGA